MSASISPIASNPAQPPPATKAPRASVSTPSSAAEEATESASVTRTEASKGDQQAVRKIAAEQQQQSTARVSPTGVGAKLDISA